MSLLFLQTNEIKHINSRQCLGSAKSSDRDAPSIGKTISLQNIYSNSILKQVLYYKNHSQNIGGSGAEGLEMRV